MVRTQHCELCRVSDYLSQPGIKTGLGEIAVKLIEPYAVIDIIVSGVATVEIIRGHLIRFVYYVEQTDECGQTVGVVTSRLVMPLDILMECRTHTDKAIACHQRKGLVLSH